jgi:hypothetical protein
VTAWRPQPLPWIPARRTRAFRLAARLFDGLGVVSPVAALRLAGLVGREANRWSRYGPSPADIQALLPGFSLARAARVARSASSGTMQRRALGRLIRQRGFDPVAPLVRPDAIAALERLSLDSRPAILVMVHAGPVQAVALALHALRIPALVVRVDSEYPLPAPLQAEHTTGESTQGAYVFTRALDHLRGSAPVVMVPDNAAGATIRVACLGRPVDFARGPFALARLSGAPVVPLCWRWDRPGVRMTLARGEMLAPESAPGLSAGECERRLAAGAADWFTRHFTANPDDLSVDFVNFLLDIFQGRKRDD